MTVSVLRRIAATVAWLAWLTTGLAQTGLYDWSHAAPLTVAFTDLTAGGPLTNWAWDFDADGVVDSTQQHPTNTYPAGNYSVQLTVGNALGSSTETKSDYVYVETLPDASSNYHGGAANGLVRIHPVRVPTP